MEEKGGAEVEEEDGETAAAAAAFILNLYTLRAAQILWQVRRLVSAPQHLTILILLQSSNRHGRKERSPPPPPCSTHIRTYKLLPAVLWDFDRTKEAPDAPH